MGLFDKENKSVDSFVGNDAPTETAVEPVEEYPEDKGLPALKVTVEIPVTGQTTVTELVDQLERAVGTVGLTHGFNDFNFSVEEYTGWEPVAKDVDEHDPEGDKVGG